MLATEHNRKHSLPPTSEPSAKRSKKGKKAKTGSKAAIPELNPSDYVRVVKVTNRDDLLHEGPVLLSKSDKANQMTLSNDRMTVTSSKGYRMVCPVAVPIPIYCKQQERLNHISLHCLLQHRQEPHMELFKGPGTLRSLSFILASMVMHALGGLRKRGTFKHL